MHKNYRRKNRYRSPWPKFRVALAWWKTTYWREYRAAVRECMGKERYDDLRDRHPRSIAWDVT